VSLVSDDGMTPMQQLAAIRERTSRLMADQQDCWQELTGLLREAGVAVLEPNELSEEEREWLRTRFVEEIFPVLTPLAVDPAHPFPFIPNKGFCLALQLRRREDGKTMDALLPLSLQIERFIRLPGDAIRFIALEQLIGLFLDRFFPGYETVGKGYFRVIRDSEMEIDEEAEDLVRTFETALKRRKRGHVVRLAVNASMPESLFRYVARELASLDADTLVLKGLVGLADTAQLIVSERADLLFPPYKARFPERIRDHGGDCFAA